MKKTLRLIEEKKQAILATTVSEGIFGDLARAMYDTLDEIELSLRAEAGIAPGGLEVEQAEFEIN